VADALAVALCCGQAIGFERMAGKEKR
jgi:hypothetical protein